VIQNVEINQDNSNNDFQVYFNNLLAKKLGDNQYQGFFLKDTMVQNIRFIYHDDNSNIINKKTPYSLSSISNYLHNPA